MTTEAPAPEAPAALNGNHARLSRQPMDMIIRNTDHLPEHQRGAIRWLHAHANENNLTNARVGALIDYSEATVSRLFGSEFKYGGDLDAVAEAITAYREAYEAEEKSGGRRAPFIETNLARHVWKLAQMARDYQRIVFLYGDSQIGKSTTLKELARREGGAVFYWEMPVGGSLHNFLGNAAEAFGMSSRRTKSELRRRIIGAVKMPKNGAPMLVIIDQMHRAFSDSRGNMLKQLSSAQLDTLDFIIELFDDSNPGIVLAGTPVFREGMAQLVTAKFFKQLRRRGLNEEGFPLPEKPSTADLNLFAKHYGLPAASGAALALQTRVIEASGLGVWITRLSMAQRNARKKKTPITWEHVVRADDFLAAAAEGKISIKEEAS